MLGGLFVSHEREGGCQALYVQASAEAGRRCEHLSWHKLIMLTNKPPRSLKRILLVQILSFWVEKNSCFFRSF